MNKTLGLFDLKDKVALVTGGSRGLGRVSALGLADVGAKLVIASRNLDSCEAVVKEIRARGGDALAHAADTSRMEQLDALLDKTYEHFGRLDILVNNAGTHQHPVALSDMSPELYDQVFAVNVKGPWYLASRAAPRMGKDGGGVVINVISIGAFRSGPFLGCYSASKAALYAFNKVMAQEWASLNVRVNALAPGPYHTDMMDETIKDIPGFDKIADEATLRKRMADPEEIVGSVLYLASEASSFTTGQVLISDGGITAT